ncbi:MAG: N-acetylmuramoyl-L-alanine amidase [Nitrospirae bacterium]|nr:N-acetylmuramoyl-L-alanine amidase [Nitrospirota bacterium]
MLDRVSHDRKKRKFRSNWDRCISEFDRVIRKYPSSPYSGDAAFLKGVAYEGIYKVTRVRADQDAALVAYQYMMESYPENGRIPDALDRMGAIYLDRGDKRTAAGYYRLLADNYPKSPLAKGALAKLKTLPAPATSAARQAKEPAPEPLSRVTEQPAPASTSTAPETSPSGPAATAATAGAAGTVAAPSTVKEAAPPVSSAATPRPGLAVVRSVRFRSDRGTTRLVLDVDGEVTYESSQLTGPDRVFFDIRKAALAAPLIQAPVNINDGIIKSVRASQYDDETVRVVLDLDRATGQKSFLLTGPTRLVVDVHGNPDASSSSPSQAPAHPAASVDAGQPSGSPSGSGRHITVDSTSPAPPPPAVSKPEPAVPAVAHTPTPKPEPATIPAAPKPEPTAVPAKAVPPEPKPESKAVPAKATTASPAKPQSTKPARTSIPEQRVHETRADLGIIVLDPGHGGHDSGAVGKYGLKEKDVVLDIGKRLRDLIEDSLGCKVVMTRDTDVFVELNDRPRLASQKEASLFISIHANASRNRSARGIETYLLNTTKDRYIMEVAAMENAMTMDKMGALEMIITDLALIPKREESLKLAHAVQANLVGDLSKTARTVNDKGVKQGPFLVLYGADMPSILTEVGFISNPEEERLLGSASYRQEVAEAIFDGIKEYVKDSDVMTAHR